MMQSRFKMAAGWVLDDIIMSRRSSSVKGMCGGGSWWRFGIRTRWLMSCWVERILLAFRQVDLLVVVALGY